MKNKRLGLKSKPASSSLVENGKSVGKRFYGNTASFICVSHRLFLLLISV